MAWLLEKLPEALRLALVHGSEGAIHLGRAAALAQEAGFDLLARRLTLAAWCHSPLDRDLARRAATVAGADSQAALVAAGSRPPEQGGEYPRLVGRRDAAGIKRYLERRAAEEPDNLCWARLGLAHALAGADWDWAGRVQAGLPETLGPLKALLAGDLAMLQGSADRAVNAYRAAGSDEVFPGLAHRLGLARLAQGDEAGAGRNLRAALARDPWLTGALLVLSDLEAGVPGSRRRPPGRTAVCLYTFNKCDDLERTLRGLAAADPGPAGSERLIVLDNASTDDTPAVLAAWRERLGPERLEVVTLPVNVGAPGARNWLMSLPGVRASDYTAFLDDDAVVLPDWLALLGAARERYPRAGVWGARVVDAANPVVIQSADGFLLPYPASEDLHVRRFSLTNCHLQTLDRGQFAYLRPCATVTGCCHLFATDRLLAQGGFDLRYSPSQYDDLDHDLRLLLAGLTPVYQGGLRVEHFKSTGRQGLEGGGQFGLGHANQLKLNLKFDFEELERAARVADSAAWEDALAKWRGLDLESQLPGGGDDRGR